MVLLDTQVLVWSLLASNKVSKAAHSAINRARNRDGLAISAMSLYELARMFERGRIHRRGSLEDSIQFFVEGISIRPLTLEVAALAAQFPLDFPGDPGDRIIAATARAANES